MNDIETRFGGTFSPATRRKIAVSYGIYTPMICDAFTALHGRRTNPGEKERFIHYFICSSLFDDFTDTIVIPEAELRTLSFSPETFVPRTFDERVFKESHLLLKNFVQDPPSYLTVTKTLFQAQWDSKKQYKGAADPAGAPGEGLLSDEAIRRITFDKGGNSVLLCSYYLDLPASSAEKECWYRIGTIIQLTNDLFDIYKDLGDHIDTLPNRMTDARIFRGFFEEQVLGMQSLIRDLPVSPGRKGAFRLSMAGIYAFGLIALEQLNDLQGAANELPALASLPRAALIIDMEKRKNLLKWLRLTYEHARR